MPPHKSTGQATTENDCNLQSSITGPVTELSSKDDPNHEIIHLPDEERWVIGEGSKFGIRSVWRTGEAELTEDHPPTHLDMDQYLEFREFLHKESHNTQHLLPHPEDHLGARLAGHHGHIRTIAQFCAAILELHRLKDDTHWHIKDKTWKKPLSVAEVIKTAYKDEEVVAAFLYNLFAFNNDDTRADCLDAMLDYARVPISKSVRLAGAGKCVDLGRTELMRILAMYTSDDHSNQEWQEPKNHDETWLVKMAMLWYLKVRSSRDEKMRNTLSNMVNSGHKIVYCDKKLPGHELTFAQGVKNDSTAATLLAKLRVETGADRYFAYGRVIQEFGARVVLGVEYAEDDSAITAVGDAESNMYDEIFAPYGMSESGMHNFY